MAAELQRGNPGFGLANQIRSQQPSGHSQFGGLHDRVAREGSLMRAGSALIVLEPAAVNQPMLMAVATGTAEAAGPARHLEGCLALSLGAAEAQELRQGDVFPELDTTAHHNQTMLILTASRRDESLWPTSLLKCCLALLRRRAP